jgi:hypothetical protein
MIVHLHGMAFTKDDSRDENYWWATDVIEGFGITMIQWDGSSDFLIHGHSMRRLPDLDLGRLWGVPETGKTAIEIEILASPDYRRKVSIPVQFIVDDPSWTRHVTGEPQKDWL